MKKIFLLATAIAALASCADESFVGDQQLVDQAKEKQGAIVFSTSTPAITRALTGKDAATELNNAFVVGGFKGDASVATTTVFDNYNVQWTQNSANTTTSNTANWDYVGLDVNPLASIYHTGDKQTIKYWDYSQNQYDFIAYSLGTGGATVTAITPETATTTVIPSGKTTAGAYTLSGTTAQLSTVHIADLVTVLNANYNKEVDITFRSMMSKVRVGLYETVPGYSVKDVKFYTSDDAIDGGSSSTTAALYAGSSVLPTSGTYTVYFKTVNDATPTTDKNKAHVDLTTSTATQTNQTFGALTTNYVGRQKYEDELSGDAAKLYLGRTSNACTFAGTTTPFYQNVLPYETGTALTLKVDYTLVSIDGTKETIKVVGAKAVVPAIYAQWRPGYAYTYIFKISDNTNGWSSGVESNKIDGLHPITFDAIVVQTTDNVQETVTTVATPSITTYQHVPAVNASANNEYKAGDIYVMVMDGGTPKADLNGATTPAVKDAAKLYTLSKSATEAEVMEALNMQASVDGENITGRNGLVLTNVSSLDNEITTIPGADDNNITVTKGTASKFTATANTTYAYVYTVTQKSGTDEVKSEAVSLTTEPTGWPTGYYTNSECTTGAPDTFAEGTYYVKYTVNNGVYAVKVIKVAASS